MELRSRLADHLKPHGFRKKGALFERKHSDEVFDFIECSSTRSAPQGCFDFRLLAYSYHVAYELEKTGKVDRVPNLHFPAVHFDITRLSGRTATFPFRICSESDFSKVTSEVKSLVDMALPVLGEASTAEGLHRIRTEHPILRIRERDPAKEEEMRRKIGDLLRAAGFQTEE